MFDFDFYFAFIVYFTLFWLQVLFAFILYFPLFCLNCFAWCLFAFVCLLHSSSYCWKFNLVWFDIILSRLFCFLLIVRQTYCALSLILVKCLNAVSRRKLSSRLYCWGRWPLVWWGLACIWVAYCTTLSTGICLQWWCAIAVTVSVRAWFRWEHVV